MLLLLGLGKFRGLCIVITRNDGRMGSENQGNPIIKLGSCYEMRTMTVFTTTKQSLSICDSASAVRFLFYSKSFFYEYVVVSQRQAFR
jgi:hypothetical protein